MPTWVATAPIGSRVQPGLDAKKADADFKISVARRSSAFSFFNT